MYKMKTLSTFFTLMTLMLGVMSGSATAQNAFKQLFMPTGIATTEQGDVVALSTNFSSMLLSKFAPDGSVITQARLGSDPTEVALLEGAYLANDPSGDFFYLLAPEGRAPAPRSRATRNRPL